MARAIVFDAYGTLFDVHSVARKADELFPGKGAALSQLWRTRQLEYTWLRSLMGRYEDFSAVTRSALRYASSTLTLPLDEARTAALMEAYLHLSPYAEVPAALARLQSLPLAILSNGSPAMLDPMVRNAGLAGRFSAVLSVDALRIYKPHPSVYQYAVDRLSTPARDIAFISSNYWDVAGATVFGFRTFWINRTGAQPDELGVQPEAQFGSLTDLIGRV